MKLHWCRDCELVEIDRWNFKPEKITKLEHIDAREYYNPDKFCRRKLYDLAIDNENSFVVNSIVVHNSAVEFGTIGSSKLEGGVFRASTLTRNKRAFAVGASQGGAVVPSATIKPQAPKSYVRSSINNPMVQYKMTEKMAENIMNTINRFSMR